MAGLVSEVIPDKSCLIFCSTKKNCESLVNLLCSMLPRRFTEHKLAERETLIKAIENDMGSTICPILGKSIMRGIAYHHSGLTADERRHLEEAFRCGVLCVICCTSTLAAGVNLPAKRVIIRSPYVGRDFITLSKYKQVTDCIYRLRENWRLTIFVLLARRWWDVLEELVSVKLAKASWYVH